MEVGQLWTTYFLQGPPRELFLLTIAIFVFCQIKHFSTEAGHDLEESFQTIQEPFTSGHIMSEGSI